MIFGIGKKKQAPPTFKDRVTAFWEWYPTVADQLFVMIEENRSEGIAPLVAPFMEETMPGLAWVFGPGENGGHSFTVSGEGVLAKQFLAAYWHSRALTIPRWTFYASRQPTEAERLKSLAIRLGEHEQVDVETLMLRTTVDEEAEKIHLVAWHPALERLPEDHHYRILFLLLDEALGEFGTEMYLGEIHIEPFAKDDDTRPLAELPKFIEHVNKYYEWNKLPPIESYAVYELPEQADFRRGDTMVGTTCITNILFEFLENEGRLPDDPLEGTGAELAYVAFDGDVFPLENHSEARGEVEDALASALEGHLSGRTLGGALGIHHAYIDLLLVDGDNSRQLVQATLNELGLNGRAQIESMA